MDRHCKDCIHKGYQENDLNKVWPFCTCKDKDLRVKLAEFWNYAHKYSIRSGIEHKLKEFPEESILSCQMVQAGYSEIYGTTCPNYKGVENE